MGKYQLDDKGRAQVTRYHEKHSKGGAGKKRTLAQPQRTIFKQEQEKIKVRAALAFLLVGGKDGITQTNISR